MHTDVKWQYLKYERDRFSKKKFYTGKTGFLAFSRDFIICFSSFFLQRRVLAILKIWLSSIFEKIFFLAENAGNMPEIAVSANFLWTFSTCTHKNISDIAFSFVRSFVRSFARPFVLSSSGRSNQRFGLFYPILLRKFCFGGMHFVFLFLFLLLFVLFFLIFYELLFTVKFLLNVEQYYHLRSKCSKSMTAL